MKLRWLLLATPALVACEGVSGGDVPETRPSPRQVIALLDLSGSQRDAHRAQARSGLDRVIEGLGYADRLVLIQVHQRSAAEEEAVRWSETAPAPGDGRAANSLHREKLDALKQAARSVARSIFEAESAGSLPTTDLFATLHIAAEYVRDEGQRRTHLVLLSDMLQSAHGVEMSNSGGVPPLAWIRSQSDAGLLPRLDGACITVIGADATSANGVAVREFWQAYFEASGAALPEANYRLITTDRAVLDC